MNATSISVTYSIMTTLIVMILCFLINYHWKRRKLYSLAAKLHGPPTVPIFGNALHFATSSDELLNRLRILLEKYPSPSRFWFGSKLCIIVYNPDQIEAILTDPRLSYKDQTYQFMAPFVGQGLISGSGSTWKLHRRLILQTFNTKTLNSYQSIYNRHSKILLDKFHQNVKTEEVEIIDYFNHCTIDIICETLMGIQVGAQNDENQPFVHSIETGYRVVHERMLKVWLHPECLFRFSNCYKETMEAQRIIRDFAQRHINQKKEEFAKVLASNSEPPLLTTMEHLFKVNQNGEYFTDEELRDEIYTLFTAGQDTTATIGSFGILMVAMHPDVQEKVYREICEYFPAGQDHIDVEVEHLAKMKYLEMVFKEVVRLFPIGPMIIRETHEDIQVKNFTIPSGCSVMITMIQTHRLPEYWPEPDAFLPERFEPALVATRHPYAYIPFSAGIRSCIGQKYAGLVVKTMMVHILRKYKVSCSRKYEDLRLKCDISTRSRDGYKVQLIPRRIH